MVLLSAQEPAKPTSWPVESTHHPVFQGATGPCDMTTARPYSNFRLSMDYHAPPNSKPRLLLHNGYVINLPLGEQQNIEIAYEHLGTTPALIRIWRDGKLIEQGRKIPNSSVSSSGSHIIDPETSRNILQMDRDFTAMVKFKTNKQGTLIAKAPATGKWAPNAKALFIKGGRLIYDIGWLGAISSKTKVNDNKEHTAVLVTQKGIAKLYIDGKLETEKKTFTKPDAEKFVFKIGSASTNFGGDYKGTIYNVRFWKRSLDNQEIQQLSTGKEKTVNTSDFFWTPQTQKSAPQLTTFGDPAISTPGYPTRIKLLADAGFQLRNATVQALDLSDHAKLIRGWNKASHKRGETLYQQLCVTCHGDLKKAGSLPTAPRFHQGTFKNGSDPYRMFLTLQKGYGQMAAQPQYSTSQKYDLIHYIRETFLKDKNESQLTKIDTAYLQKLPRGMSTKKEKKAVKKTPQYLLQDFGNSLFWTLQVEKGNIAQKGIAIRMDEGPGGISKGHSWMLYDHDTMRLAACWSGDRFVDWRGIAFDGSHGSHTSIVGEKHFISPNLPMWANPATGDFKDTRVLGRDGRPYGPLPQTWVHFKGLENHNGRPILRYTVGDCLIRELPEPGLETNTFQRTFFCGPTSTELKIRLDGTRIHTIPASNKATQFTLLYSNGKVQVTASSKTRQAPSQPTSKRFPNKLTTRIVKGDDDGPFAIDVLTPPSPGQNPWQSWMRTTGFDFFDRGEGKGKSAAICTWNGDVWIVDGIDQPSGTLIWQRICSGLFQPLGLKIVHGEIYVGCRDMIAKLTDLNGDRETDLIENFNNDHQVTEHFHEFAMGLQTDAEGNFYYAKSARHALKAVIPHHGTLLRVSKDGSQTDILATGFRAANGVCLNPDGTFVVTDQEGHWNPKNRINWVKGNGVDDFYGNIYGYHNVTDEADSAMTPPLCWITNSFDRSPSELLWVPKDSAWKSLRGSLLNLSYGYGKVYVVPHEDVNGVKQGGMCQLPFNQFPTGIMRGRFHPGDGQLYGCGMFAWGGNQKQPGGFYRIRATGKPAYAPTGLHTAKEALTITFTDPLDPESAVAPSSWTIQAWDLKRTKKYGSKHYNQREWIVKKATLSADGKTVTLTIPELAPTWGMSITAKVLGKDRKPVTRVIHNSIHKIPGS